jgi:hypothetical protein
MESKSVMGIVLSLDNDSANQFAVLAIYWLAREVPIQSLRHHSTRGSGPRERLFQHLDRLLRAESGDLFVRQIQFAHEAGHFAPSQARQLVGSPPITAIPLTPDPQTRSLAP